MSENVFVRKTEKAEFAAQFLEDNFWKKAEDTGHERNEQIINGNQEYNTEKITLKELREVIKKSKRRKAPGPDDIVMEAYMEMDDNNLKKSYKC